jgi:hypothetical protein
MKKWLAHLALAAALGSLLISIQPALAQGTAFTYQGQLQNNGSPAGGHFDLTFELFNAAAGGSQVGSTLTNLDIGVSNGLFTTTLDFGPGVFTGGALWLQIGVETNGGSAFLALRPLQELTPTPYAITAENVTGTIPLAQLPSTVVTNNEGAVTLNNLTLNGNLALPFPATVYSGGIPVLRDDGNFNFFAGFDAGNTTLTGADNTAVGDFSFLYATTGKFNAALGFYALDANSSGSYNTASGAYAMWFNTTGSNNTATGAWAMSAYNVPANLTGGGNTADGAYAMAGNETGYNNVAVGYQALFANTNGYENVAIGVDALQFLNSGSRNFENTAVGDYAGQNMTFGDWNTALGYSSFAYLTNGDFNLAIGIDAGYYLDSGSDDIYIGSYGEQGDYNVTRIGEGQNETYISSWNGSFLDGVLALDGSDTNNGLVFTSASGLPGIDPGGNGVFLYGYNGGALGTVAPLGVNLSWDFHGNVWVSNNLSAASINCSPGALSFGSSPGQMLSLYSNSFTCYAIGVQNQDMYFRCGADVSGTGFAWFRGGQPNSSPFDNGGGTTLMTLTAAGLTVNGTFVSACDRNVKRDFAPVDCRKVLEKVSQLPEQTWAYKDDPGTKHLGPMAQDFYAAFGTGADDKHIAVVDEGGVALAAIQGLDQKLNEKDAEIQNLKRQNDSLVERLNELEAAVKQLAARK